MIAKPKPLRAAAYIRMSDKSQEGSPEQQRAEIIKLAGREGCEIVRWYDKDLAISGDATERRLDFQRMIHDAEQNEFDVIICWDQDRFGRFDSIEAGRWIHPLRQAGVRLLTVAQDWIDWTSFAGRLIYSVQQEGKNQYLVDLSRNVVRGSIAAARDGKMVRACFGYRKVEGRLIVEPSEAAVVRRAFAEYAKPDVSLRLACERLTRDGVRTPTGAPWQATTLRVILRRRKYTGAYYWGEAKRGKYHYAGDDGNATARNGDRRRHIGEPLVFRPDDHEPLVDVATFEAVQAKLDRRHQTRSSSRRDYLLSGLLRCGHCGEAMQGHWDSRRDGTGYREYQCSGYHAGGKAKCNCNRIIEAPLVRAILDKLRTEYLAPDRLDALREALRQRQQARRPAATTGDAAKLRQRIAQLDRQIDQGAERVFSAPASLTDTLYAKLESLQRERDRLKADLEAAERPVVQSEAKDGVIIEKAIEALWRLSEAVEKADPAKLANLLRQAVSRIEVWFDHRQAGKYIRSSFKRGTVHLRPVPEMSLLCKTASVPLGRFAPCWGPTP